MDRKAELLAELEGLLRAKRRAEGSKSLRRFIDIYLGHLMTAERPQFHEEIIDLMTGMVGEQGHDSQNSKETRAILPVAQSVLYDTNRNEAGGGGTREGVEKNN